jgi:hypothetical protein
MKQKIAIAFLCALAPIASAALSFTPSYSGSVFHTHSNADAVIGFAWASDHNLYYATSTDSYTSGGLHRKDGAASTELIAPNGSLFSGSGVVAIGSSIYYNDSDFTRQYIRNYDVVSDTVTPTTVTNYALGTDGTNLFTTGSANYVTTDILYYTNGNLATPFQLGSIAGSSGPAVIDAVGNLFYAPGYGDLSIYRWSAGEVAAALLGGPELDASGHLFVDYEASFPTVSGASSMVVDAAGNLLVTLTDFANPSGLVKFDPTGTSNEVAATTTDRLGGLSIHNGQLYVASGNQIFAVIPEPSSLALSLFALVPLALLRRR